ncbi:MAG: hypothetical protein AAGG53_06315 [Cyanobacteria bacterium P01_H01_bin.152]
MSTPPPRIYCLLAIAAPVVVVFRRGPTEWSHVGLWDLAANRYESGGWLQGRIFPRRSDVSPDGQWLCYFAHNPKARWQHGEAYIAVSKLPWLTALHAFATLGTWTRGYYFTADGSCDDDLDAQMPIAYGLRAIPIEQFANERRRGWQAALDSPPRSAGGPWDEHRNARLRKPQPGGDHCLHLASRGRAGGEFGIAQAVGGLRVQYSLQAAGELMPLTDVQWADWDSHGRLLVATRDGRLQVRELSPSTLVTFEVDLSTLTPAQRQRSPAWAQRW